jgi:hypothetical protein
LQVNVLLVLSRRVDATTSVNFCSVPILVSLLFSFLIYCKYKFYLPIDCL